MDKAGDSSSVLERRLGSEWSLLQHLAAANPDRISEVHEHDTTFRLTLMRTPAFLLPASPGKDAEPPRAFQDLPVVTSHRLRIEFPLYYPAAPLELYMDQPALHPNIHPETGFVCLWDRHRISNTIEHALHKIVAILGWKLRNDDPVHVMQSLPPGFDPNSACVRLDAPLLTGVLRDLDPESAPPVSGRRRLS